MTLQSRSFLH